MTLMKVTSQVDSYRLDLGLLCTSRWKLVARHGKVCWFFFKSILPCIWSSSCFKIHHLHRFLWESRINSIFESLVSLYLPLSTHYDFVALSEKLKGLVKQGHSQLTHSYALISTPGYCDGIGQLFSHWTSQISGPLISYPKDKNECSSATVCLSLFFSLRSVASY